MLDTNTVYLLLVMVAFICFAIVLVHYHKSTDQIQRKKSEVENYSYQLQRKIDAVEHKIVDLRLKIDELDNEISEYKG